MLHILGGAMKIYQYIELTGQILWKVPRCALHELEVGRCENFLMSHTEAPPVWQKLPSRSFKEKIGAWPALVVATMKNPLILVHLLGHYFRSR